MVRPCSCPASVLSWQGGANDKEHAMPQTPKTVGIDIGKNSFHVVGHDKRGAIVLRQKRGQYPLERMGGKQGTSFVDIAILRFLVFAFVKAFQDRRAPWYQRGLIRKPLREIGVILLHDVERCFLGEIAMVLGK
jgi:hypothetical protein